MVTDESMGLMEYDATLKLLPDTANDDSATLQTCTVPIPTSDDKLAVCEVIAAKLPWPRITNEAEPLPASVIGHGQFPRGSAVANSRSDTLWVVPPMDVIFQKSRTAAATEASAVIVPDVRFVAKSVPVGLSLPVENTE